MGLLDKKFGKRVDKEYGESIYKRSEDQSVIVFFYHYEYEELDELFALDDRLRQVLSENSLGRYDGHEIAMEGTDGSIYMYGPSAEKIFVAIKPILEETDFMRGAIASLRFGSRFAKTIEVEI
ncbi:MAG TPA: hypothetical protein VEV87_01275 [Chitinophagaceae bacterium]|nr:hypothetical protein [Chitinophagaceae bacterium]